MRAVSIGLANLASDDGGGEVHAGGEFIGCLEGVGQSGCRGTVWRSVVAFTQDAAFAQWPEPHRLVGSTDAGALAAWIAEGAGPIVDDRTAVATTCTSSAFVGWRHDHHIGQATEIRRGRSCRRGWRHRRRRRPARSMAKRTGSDWMCDVVDDLVVGALQEGGVDGAEWASCPRSPCRRRR